MSEVYINKQQVLTSDMLPNSYWNLLDGTADFSNISNNTYDGNKDTQVKTPANNISFYKNKAWNYPLYNYSVQKNKVYTFSFSVKFMKKINGEMIIYGDSKYSILKQVDLDLPNQPLNTWTRAYYTIKANIDGEIPFGVSASADGETYVGDYMLNEGINPLNWNMSLNDLKSKLGGVKQSPRPVVTVLYTALPESEVA